MKKSFFVLLSMMLMLPATATEISESLAAAADGEVIVSNIAGSVSVRGWSRDSVEVSGRLGEDIDELIFERRGDEVTIKVKAPNRFFGRKDIASELAVRVPSGSSLQVTTVSAGIDVRDVEGALELQAVSGSIDAQIFGEDAEISTVSGRINAEGDSITGDAELASVSGEINVQNLSGDLRAESVSGGLNVAGGTFDGVDLETVNGSIVFRSGLDRNGDFNGESVNGSINVRISNSLSARYDIETFNGSIRNCFGRKAERTSRYAPGWRLNFTQGDGDARVSIETLNGSINFCAG